MSGKLAKLTDLKASHMLNMSEVTLDVALTELLEAATATAERLAGRLLTRVVGEVEKPWSDLPRPARVRLRHFPIESVGSVKEASCAANDAAFEALTALVEFQDYIVDHPLGKLERIATGWDAQPYHIQVIYNGGYLDPETTVNAWADATAYTAGDLVESGGLTYAALVDHVSSSSLMPPEEATWAMVHLPPGDLQRGILLQAVKSWRTGAFAGTPNFTAGSAGSQSIADDAVVPELRAACETLRFYA